MLARLSRERFSMLMKKACAHGELSAVRYIAYREQYDLLHMQHMHEQTEKANNDRQSGLSFI